MVTLVHRDLQAPLEETGTLGQLAHLVSQDPQEHLGTL